MKRILGVIGCVMFSAATLAGQTPRAASSGEGSAMRWLVTEEGKPIDSRPTEKSDNTPAFP